MKSDTGVVVIHNILSPYKTLLFNALAERCDDLHVMYLAETERIRDWTVQRDDLRYAHEVLAPGALEDENPLRLAIRAWQRLESLRPRVVVIGGYSHPAFWAAFFWARRRWRPIILWSSSTEEDRSRVTWREAPKRYLVRRCRAANVYGSRGRDYLVKLGMRAEDVFIIGQTTDNGFYRRETEVLRPERERLRRELGAAPRNFLYVGRFSPEKNLPVLLEAYARLGEARRDWGLILLGDGPQRNAIERFVAERSLPNVLIPGFQPNGMLPRFFAVSDMLVLPSLSETWGLVVNEAMAGGLPAIVSRRCGCVPDLARHGETALTFEPEETDALCKWMTDVANGAVDVIAMGARACEAVAAYTPAAAAEEVVKTLEHAAGG